MQQRLPLACGFALWLTILNASQCTVVRADDAASIEFFEKRIRPDLVEHCYACHSGGEKIKGGLRLDSRDGWVKGGDSGAAIVPGKTDESLLVEAVPADGDLKMPPKCKLAPMIVADFQNWV